LCHNLRTAKISNKGKGNPQEAGFLIRPALFVDNDLGGTDYIALLQPFIIDPGLKKNGYNGRT